VLTIIIILSKDLGVICQDIIEGVVQSINPLKALKNNSVKTTAQRIIKTSLRIFVFFKDLPIENFEHVDGSVKYLQEIEWKSVMIQVGVEDWKTIIKTSSSTMLLDLSYRTNRLNEVNDYMENVVCCCCKINSSFLLVSQ
jgi:hypothetical protein